MSAAALAWVMLLAANEPQLRTYVVPTAGTAVAVHDRVLLRGSAETRVPVGPRSPQAQAASVEARVGTRIAATRVFSVGLDYAYAFGVYPIEGPGLHEHRVTAGMTVGTPVEEGRRVALRSRTRVDLRTYRAPWERYGFHVRPRSELVLTGIIRPFFQISLGSEAVIQPDLGSADMLQLRLALALHGRIDFARGKARPPGGTATKAPPIALSWYVGDQLALHPVAMARSRLEKPLDRATDQIGVRDVDTGRRGDRLDMMLMAGLFLRL